MRNMFKILPIVMIVGITIFLLLVTPINGLAAKKETQDSVDMIGQIMNSNPADADSPITKKPNYKETTYTKEFSYSRNIVFSGNFDTESYYFKVQDYWEFGYAYAQVEFSLSQLIKGADIPASLTFSLNHVPIYTCKVDYENGKNQTIYVDLPIEMLNEGYNSFDITGYVRIYNEDGCIDNMTGANWINIKDSSSIVVGYEAVDSEDLISYYPYPFMSSMDEVGLNAVIAVSDQQVDAELAAALLLRADLSTETDKEDQIVFTTYENLPRDKESRIVFLSTLENLPAEYANLLPKDLEDLSGQAVILNVHDVNKRPVLLIVSKNGDALMEAAMMLVDEERVSQEITNITYVKNGASEVIKNASKPSDLATSNHTIEGIIGSGIAYVGPFHQNYDISLPYSTGYSLAESAKIVLNYRYSENLDFDRSLITVYWGDVPVASKKLSKENASGDELAFTLPKDVIGTSASKISIAFDLELKDLYCTQRMDDMPWAYVTGDSSFYLPVGVEASLSFDIIPYPFETTSVFNQVLVVVPDKPTQTELDTLGQVIAFYGTSITPYGNLKVIHASEFNEEDSDYNIIIIGNYQDNSVLASINDHLSFRYEEGGTKFASNSQLLLSDDYSRRIGILQLISSPYAKKRALLAITAVDDKGLLNLSDFLHQEENIWKLTEDTVIIDQDGEMKSYQFMEQYVEKEQLNLKQFVEENKDSLIFTIVSTSAMFLMLLVVILFLSRIYKIKRK